MDTYHVGLTKASDNTVHHDFLLAEGREGQPRVRLGSREKEVAKAGQRGTIVIQSLHHGSGQHIARDPMMYEFADGMFADDPGVVKARGAITTVHTLATNAVSYLGARGAVVGYAGGFPVSVTPHAIYELGVSKATPPASAHFTGSEAVLGDNQFFGTRDNAGGSANWATIRQPNGVWSNNAGFKASYLAGQADKMFRLRPEAMVKATKSHISWTDDVTNANPIFSTEYTLTSLRTPRDLAIIGPHAVVLLGDPYLGSSLVSVDAEGMFTSIIDSGLSMGAGLQFAPYLNGQLVPLAGRPRALWLPDVSSMRMIELLGMPSNRGSLDFPAPADWTKGPGVAAADADIFFSMFGTFTKRSGAGIDGSVIVHARWSAEGLFPHIIATPEETAFLSENTHVAAMTIQRAAGTDRRLWVLTNEPNAVTSANEDWKLHSVKLWDGSAAPNSFDTGLKFLRTSRYVGDSWTTKQGELLRGYVTELPANSTAVVRVYLDGDSNETYNFSVNSAGPFAQALPSNIIGRDVALDMETNANGSVVIEFPWSLDYFAVPDQKDIVRLAVLSGRDQVLPAGGLTDKTRAETLDALAGICASPERWTLKWWDETPDWDVIPLEYEAIETEPTHVEGAGAAVAWLTLQRL